MSDQENQIAIEDLELALEVYQIESEQKLTQLQQLFQQKGSLDLSKMFYEERSTIKIKFQNIISDLIQFLVKQEVATTEKLRKTFYRILENPLLLLFKISRFEIFDLRLNGFDIQLQPIEAICELGKTLNQNIDDYLNLYKKQFVKYDGKEYASWDAYMEQAIINMIQDKIFVFYSYLRKGSNLLKKKFENKIKIVEIYNSIQQKLLEIVLVNEDKKTLKQLAVLNYQIYQLQESFDVLNFYIKVPFREIYLESFQEFGILATKAKKSSNYNLYILQFAKYGKEIMNKIIKQKIDPCFDQFIENSMKGILELWGCRICYYQQFCNLFKILFNAHSNKIKIFQICLQHTPKLEKDDVVLLRTNFKLELSKKHNQLLSLMKTRNLEEMNDFLSTFYHQQFYNMNFCQIERESIIKILTMMNGNSSLRQFFTITERAFKQWNHTIDFTHAHKFIESQFALPKLEEHKIKETFRLLTNLCYLEEKGFDKEYEQLIKGNTIGKAVLGLIQFISKSKECEQIRKFPECEGLIISSFTFLTKCLNPVVDAEDFVLKFAPLIQSIKNQQKSEQFINEVIGYVMTNISSFHIHESLTIFSQLIKTNYSQIVQVFFRGDFEMNQMVKNFRFFGKKADEIEQQMITDKEAQFIQNNCIIKNDIIAHKDTGIFKLTEFQVMTNPIQFQKVMDNYYFTLSSNSKKFLEYLVTLWFEEFNEENSPLFPFYSKLIKQTLFDYPVSLCILANTRLQIQKGEEKESRRFCEFLAKSLNTHKQVQAQLLQSIINYECIKYRNGMDYVQEQILPMILKVLLNNINEHKLVDGKQIPHKVSESAAIAAKVLRKYNLKNLKSDTIQKTIEKVRFLLSKVEESSISEKLASAHYTLLQVFFMKKEADLRKQGLCEALNKINWNEARNYTSSHESGKPVTDEIITEQIIVSPYTIAQEFNIRQYKIKKVAVNKLQVSPKTKKAEQILKNLKRINQQQPSMFLSSIKTISTPAKKIIAKNSKYSLINNLGVEYLQTIADRQNIWLEIIERNHPVQEIQPTVDKKQENVNFVQFYLKEFMIPAINHKTILEDIINLIESEEPEVSYLWINPTNLEYYFMDLFSIFEYAALEKQAREPEKEPLIDRIVRLVDENAEFVQKKILTIFQKLGYSNIWAESFNMFWLNFPIRKHLGLNKTSEQSILSILLNISLSNASLREPLNSFLGNLFETRDQQTALMYKVVMDNSLMNLVMKSLSIEHLNKISILFHSNFNNLRLYTEQLHEGLKVLNISSGNRSYNEYLKLSKTVEDEEFEEKMKLFKENFSFFIRIQREGYNFKRIEEKKLVIDRLTSLFRVSQDKENATEKIDAILKDYIKQIEELQLTIANRVKSFYLVTKLRDLSYQNSLMISILQSVMSSEKKSTEQILQQIKKVEIFSLMNRLYNELIIFEDDWRDMNKYSMSVHMDDNRLSNQLTICTNKRFSHSMSKIYEKCDLQFDEVFQRCLDALKVFFRTEEGKILLKEFDIYPAFLIKSSIDKQKAEEFTNAIYKRLIEKKQKHEFEVEQKKLIEGLIKGLRLAPLESFTEKSIQITMNGRKYTPATILPHVVSRLQENQTLICLKSTNHLIFNKYKTSEATLEEIEVLGFIICYSILNSCPLQFNLHPSIIAALSFNISDLDFLLDVDFKIWEQLKNVLSTADSSKMQLNFSYNFESLEDFKPVRIELVDKGSSKKVNNLNREQYCDLICSYVLFENLKPQIHRLLKTMLRIVPKEYICCKSTKGILELFYNQESTKKIMNLYMKKIGVVLPQTLIDEHNKRYQNLKDFQNIQWLQESILESPRLRQKYWKDETNLFIVTYVGSKGSIRLVKGAFLIEHFKNKQQMKVELAKL